jgi:hypothetical protein
MQMLMQQQRQEGMEEELRGMTLLCSITPTISHIIHNGTSRTMFFILMMKMTINGVLGRSCRMSWRGWKRG